MATPVDAQTVIAIVTVAASAGAAWAGVKVGLNGMRAASKETNETVKEIRGTLAAHVEADYQVQVENARCNSRIETKVEGVEAKIETLFDRVDELRRR